MFETEACKHPSNNRNLLVLQLCGHHENGSTDRINTKICMCNIIDAAKSHHEEREIRNRGEKVQRVESVTLKKN